MKKYKSHIIFLGIAVLALIVFYFLRIIFLPFVIGIILAIMVNPLIFKINKFIKNRSIAVTVFLTSSSIILITITLVFGKLIINDTQRLNGAFKTFKSNHDDEIKESTSLIKSYIQNIYPVDSLYQQKNKIGEQLESEDFKESLSNITSFFKSDDSNKDNKTESNDLNLFLIIIYALGYFVSIIYTFPYFQAKFKKYFSEHSVDNLFLNTLIKNFKSSFYKYFKQRSVIVLICTSLFIITFEILNVPGALLIGIFAGLLCYISHFHYLALIPISLSCWVLSIETNQSFFLFFGIILAIFIMISILEEVLFFPKIMNGVAHMNPAILMLSIALWTYLFGIFGLLIALPLTSFSLIYVDLLLTTFKPKVT
jgi:predicted PurR-regulated permease PerM